MRRDWLLLLILAALLTACNTTPTGLPPALPTTQPVPSALAQPSPPAPVSPLSTPPISPVATPPPGNKTAAPVILSTVAVTTMPEQTAAVAAPASPAATTPDVVAVGTALPGARVTEGGGRVNARGGPGTGYPIVGSLDPGQSFPVTGQVNNCAWLQTTLADGNTAWVSGDPNIVELLVPCTSVARAATVPTPRGPSVTPLLPTVEIPQVPVGQGCYIFENLQEVEETIQLTSANGEVNITVSVQPGSQNSVCVTPGKYSYTITPGAAGRGADTGATELRARQSYRWLLPGPPQ